MPTARCNILRCAVATFLWALFAGSGCSPPAPDDTCPSVAADPSGSEHPGFLYVLQPEGVSIDQIVGSRFGIVVLEPSLDGSAEGELTAEQIDALRVGGPCGPRTVLAYLSIGEAESYRDYFRDDWLDAEGKVTPSAPPWLGPQNPDFEGNFKVRYWHDDWQAVILGTVGGPDRTPLDRIVDAGFDGVYLDIIDAYEFFSGEEGDNELTRAEARELMILWVQRIAEYARVTRGVSEFLVFPQNGSDIIRTDDGELDELAEDYFAAIDGIGVEDLFFDGTDPADADDTQYRLEQLAEYTDRGKTVLATDYVLPEGFTPGGSDERLECFYARAFDEGFIPYAAVANRDLDEIVVLSSDQWSVSQPPEACPGAND